MSEKAITFLRTLLDRDSDEGVALYEDFEDEAQVALTELEAHAYTDALRGGRESTLLRCLNVAYRGIAQAKTSYRREVARRMFEVFNEETGLTKAEILKHIDNVETNWNFPGRVDMRAGFEESAFGV